jgi:hypothetical protein
MTIEPATLAILDAIRRAQPATRQGLAAECGLSAGRISASVGQLAALGLVREEIVQGGPAGRSAGRPAGRWARCRWPPGRGGCWGWISAGSNRALR